MQVAVVLFHEYILTADLSSMWIVFCSTKLYFFVIYNVFSPKFYPVIKTVIYVVLFIGIYQIYIYPSFYLQPGWIILSSMSFIYSIELNFALLGKLRLFFQQMIYIHSYFS